MAALVFGWFGAIATFAVTSGAVQLLFAGSLFGAPAWAWGLAATIGVVGSAFIPVQQ